MSGHQEFSVEVNGAAVLATLDLPAEQTSGQPVGVVMLCQGLAGMNAETGELFGQIADALVDVGLGVVRFGAGSTGTAGARQAVESVDDASAVFHALVLRDDVDPNRIGVVGYSLGGIIVACLSKRTDQIARLCLLAPMTVDQGNNRPTNNAADDLAARLGEPEVPSGFFEDVSSLSPTQDLVIHDRPTLIVHGAADRVVPPEASLAYCNALELADHQVEHVLVALADHGFSSGPARAACLDRLTCFFAPMSEPAGAAKRP